MTYTTSAMTDHEQKVQEYSSCPVHKAVCLSWSSAYTECIDSNASEGMDILAKQGKQAKSKGFHLSCLYI